jgi:lipoprotein-anchoring transpeptidase ErfK/SrfK
MSRPTHLQRAARVAGAVAKKAQADLTAAYDVAAGQPVPPANDLTGTDLGNRTLVAGAYGYDRAERRFLVVVGKPSTPTPQGEFFVEEPLALSSQAAGGRFALATSARSNVLQEFDGGPGQIGIHGTDNLSGNLGTAASRGCIRLNTGAITWLAERIGAGVPATIIA